MTQQPTYNLHLPNGGKIQTAVEFVLPDRTIKPVDPAANRSSPNSSAT